MSTRELATPRGARHGRCKRRRLTVVAFLSMAAFVAGASSASAITPGLYEVTSEIAGTAGQSAKHKSIKHCIQNPDVIETDHLTEQFGIPSCRRTSQSLSSGRISLQIQCGSGNNRLTLTGNGTYSDERYVLTSDVAIKLDDTSLRVTTRLSAQRIGEC